MNISAMPILEHRPLSFESISAVVIFKAIVHFIMNKNDFLAGSDLLDMSAVIFASSWG